MVEFLGVALILLLPVLYLALTLGGSRPRRSRSKVPRRSLRGPS
ncbi:hypothetical protein NKG05_24065 [Oerskovia sp. M15]